MPPKRTRKLEIFADSVAPTRSSPRNKRKQPDSDATVAAETGSGPTPKRPALGAKTANSRDTKRRREADTKVDAKVGAVKHETAESLPLPASQLAPSSPHNTVSQKATSPVPVSKAAHKQGSEIRKHLEGHSSDIEHLKSLIDEDEIQEASDFVSLKRLWTPALLTTFADTRIAKLDLSSPASDGSFSIPAFPSTQLLAPLFSPNRFLKLSTIILRNTTVSSDDIALLRVLPSLAVLDLTGTGISNLALHYIVCHRHTLTSLNISNNPSINDEARLTIRPLHRLKSLYLRGTNLSLPALRRLALDDLAPGCRLLSIPAHAITTINNLHEKYCVEIPAGYIEDPDKVDAMSLLVLKRNLELHAKCNKDVQVTGTKVELVHRLKTLLENRKADQKIIAILGRGEA